MRQELQGLLGVSFAMRDLAEQVMVVAREDRHALLVGELGVGKSQVARLIHELSARCNDTFCSMRCAELHDRSELADAGGTLWLDEVAYLPASLQSVLRSLLERAAVVAGTELDLATEVTEGRFDEALYYQLGVRLIHLPPLRARSREDLRFVTAALVDELRAGLPRAPQMLTDRAFDALASYNWPGNLRELRNVLERALLRARGAEWIDVMHLPAEVLDASDDVLHVHGAQTLEQVERMHIERTLRVHRANRTHAARELGISRATLIKKIRDYHLGGQDATTENQESA